MLTALVLPFVLLLAACTSANENSGSSGVVTPAATEDAIPPPADANARFEELLTLFEKARFSVVYRVDGRDDRQFSWIQEPGSRRWDEISIVDGGNKIHGRADIQLGSRGQQCLWTATGRSDVILSCFGDPGSNLFDHDWNLLLRSFFPQVRSFHALGDMAFTRYGIILGVAVECFRPQSPAGTGSEACLSQDGVPLMVRSIIRLPGSGEAGSLAAIQIREGPTPRDFESVAPAFVAVSGQEVDRVNVQRSDLNIPSMPLVDQFFQQTP